MDSHDKLFDVASASMIKVYEREGDAIDALVEVVAKHGVPTREMVRLVPHRRSS